MCDDLMSKRGNILHKWNGCLDTCSFRTYKEILFRFLFIFLPRSLVMDICHSSPGDDDDGPLSGVHVSTGTGNEIEVERGNRKWSLFPYKKNAEEMFEKTKTKHRNSLNKTRTFGNSPENCFSSCLWVHLEPEGFGHGF